MNRRKLKIFGFISLIIVSLAGSIASTISWFRETVELSPDVAGSVQGAYYAGGDGTSGNPFQIHDPIHLYNLAWLQYFGTYNKFNDSGALTTQTYFVVTSDLDMTGWTLPPIGTEDFPFLGKFDGGSHTIKGLISTNEFGSGSSVKTPQKFTGFGDTYHQPEIVGFFGVVGKLPNDSYSYTSVNNQMINCTLEGTKVESRTSKTLIGIAAGYVNATMNGVKIKGAATIDVNGTTASTAVDATNITENLSDYGLVGYSTKTGSGGSYSQKLSKFYSNGEGSGGGGEGADWGGSIDMLSLYNRLSKVYNEDSYDNGDFTVNTITDVNGVTTKQKVENLDNHFAGLSADDYSYTFNKHNAGNQNYYYLYGDYSPVSGTKTNYEYNEAIKGGTATQLKISQAGANLYYIYYQESRQTNYLMIPQLASTETSKYIGSSHKTTSIGSATKFFRDNYNGGYRFYTIQIIDDKEFYVFLYGGSSTLAVQRKDKTSERAMMANKWVTWFSSGSGIYWKNNSSTYYYLRYSSSTFLCGSNNSLASIDFNVGDNQYLNIDSDGNCMSTTDISQASILYFINSKLFTVIDGKIFYLTLSNSSIKAICVIAENDATSWTYSSESLSFQYSNTTYYLDMSKVTMHGTDSIKSTLTEVGTGDLSNVTYLSEKVVTSDTNPSLFKNTYLPLSVSGSNIYSTSNNNTGYIISGKQFVESDYASVEESRRYRSGDIRVSRYDMDNISESLGQNTFDNSKLYAITATSNSDYSLITDTNNNGTNVPSGLSSITGRKTAASLNRYNDWSIAGGATNTGARVALGNVFTNDSSNIYGLHFMNASISSSNVVTIPNAKINGVTYTSRKMPKDSIDFVVKDIGYITFFAGTYFGVGYDSVNTSFFSLHQISRNNDGEITDITEIKDIWKDNSNNYYYNPTNTTNLTKLFDTEVLTNPSKFINNAVYYFEIPVSAGEYALGSVSGKNGAYLMYLDISASGEQVLVDTLFAYSITTKNTGNAYPVGVDFVPTSVTGDGGETIAISIASGEQGSLIIAISNKDISVTDTSSIANYAYKSSKCVDSDPNDNQFICNLSGAPPTSSGGGVRILNIDLSKTNGDTYSIRITDILSDDSGTIDSSTFELNSGSGFVGSTQSAIEALSTEINLTNLRELEIAAILSRATGTGEFVTTYNTANCSDANKIVDVDIDLNGTTISVGVTANYTFRINGEPYADSSTYPAS